MSISQFVENLRESADQARRSEDLILALELPIISSLKGARPHFILPSGHKRDLGTHLGRRID